jgi:hypothetical protein
MNREKFTNETNLILENLVRMILSHYFKDDEYIDEET